MMTLRGGLGQEPGIIAGDGALTVARARIGPSGGAEFLLGDLRRVGIRRRGVGAWAGWLGLVPRIRGC